MIFHTFVYNQILIKSNIQQNYYTDESIAEEQMQVEEQDVEDQQEDENIFPNDEQNNEERDIQTENSQQSMYCIVIE